MNEKHFGCPGPGGSLGQCAICGESFIKEIIFSKIGMDSETSVRTFKVAFCDAVLYAHDPKCIKQVEEAFNASVIVENAVSLCKGKLTNLEIGKIIHSNLPDGPLRELLATLLKEQPEGPFNG